MANPTADRHAAHGLPPEVLEALTAGRRVEAVKRLREATGLGLKDAKTVVDAAAASAPFRHRAAPREDTGLLRLVLAGCAVGTAVAAYLLLAGPW